MITLTRGIRSLLGRSAPVFEQDLRRRANDITARVEESSFLVLGGAGSIGRSVVMEIFRRRPRKLHVIDVSENNLVELVRDIRSSEGYIDGDFRTLPLDCGSVEFDAYMQREGPFDYVLNLFAMKHVRSEKDPYSLMRMVHTNVGLTVSTLEQAIETGAQRYFAVSSDKAVNPANAMGATKRAMELALIRASGRIEVTSARFANVAFSDGSLLHGFQQRLAKRQPISAPEDVRRYFITGSEAAILCLLSILLGQNRETFFPASRLRLAPTSFRELAERTLEAYGYRASPCTSEEEARSAVELLAAQGAWPCYFFESDTTGEKGLEEFTTADEEVDSTRFEEIDVVRLGSRSDSGALDGFLRKVKRMRSGGQWSREEILDSLRELVPEFHHQETGRFLDNRM